MRRPAALFPIVFALWAIILAPRGGAQAQDAQEGRREIEKCQTIDKAGSYKLVKNLTSAPNAPCLTISADFVTVDLAGFAITSGGGIGVFSESGITTTAVSPGQLQGIAIRNGSISNFPFGVTVVNVNGAIVEGLRVSCASTGVLGILSRTFISAGRSGTTGIVKGNVVISCRSGIDAAGTITGNNVSFPSGNPNGLFGIGADQGSTVIGNTAANFGTGIDVTCPSNVTNNTAINNGTNLVLDGEGCNNTNNVAP